jgi:hypothetical protein
MRTDDLLNFIERNRRQGSTSLLREVAENNDVYYLVFREDQKQTLNVKGAISFGELEKGLTLEKKPVLVDVAFLHEFVQYYDTKIVRLSMKNQELENKIQRIKDALL